MADKKYKTNIDIEADLKISSSPSNRALILDSDQKVKESVTTDTQIGYLSNISEDLQTSLDNKIETSEKGAANGVATLDANSKIPSSQVPAIAITDVFEVADIAARDALTIGSGDGEVQEGDVVIVTDASADPAITAGAASYIYDGSAYKLLKAGDEVLSVNGETGVVTLDADDISDAATTNKFATQGQLDKVDFLTVTQAVDLDTLESDVATNNAKVSADGSVTTHNDVTDAGSGIIISAAERTKLEGIEALAEVNQTDSEIKTQYEANSDTNAFTDAEQTKLGGIEALADVTDATNVAAAGATMDSDTSLVGNGYFLDEDDMNSDDATKVASQQSIKAYVDTTVSTNSSLATGDIKNSSFSGAADTATDLDVTGLAFANGTVRSFNAIISVVVDATANLYEEFNIKGIQKGSDWDISIESVGDDSQVSFDITSAGQIQYNKTTTAGWVSTTINFRADTTTV
jgi:hypothetical protein